MFISRLVSRRRALTDTVKEPVIEASEAQGEGKASAVKGQKGERKLGSGQIVEAVAKDRRDPAQAVTSVTSTSSDRSKTMLVIAERPSEFLDGVPPPCPGSTNGLNLKRPGSPHSLPSSCRRHKDPWNVSFRR